MTEETSWEQPDGHTTLVKEIDAVVDMVEGLEGELSEIDPLTTVNLLPIIASHARDKKVVRKVCGVLSAACKSKTTAQMLADQERIGDVISALQYNIGVCVCGSFCVRVWVHLNT